MLKIKNFPGEHAPGRTPLVDSHGRVLSEPLPTLQLQTCCAIQSQTTKAPPPPPRDLPLRPHLVRLLVGSHLPVKQPGFVPGSSYDLFHLTCNLPYRSFKKIKAAKMSHTVHT